MVDALKEPDTKMASMKDQKAIMDQINSKNKNASGDKKKDSMIRREQRMSNVDGAPWVL